MQTPNVFFSKFIFLPPFLYFPFYNLLHYMWYNIICYQDIRKVRL
jgi:hypothetical protein